MTSYADVDPVPPELSTRAEAPAFDDSVDQQAVVSSVLASVFRGKFCDFILPNRTSTRFNKHDVIYNVGDDGRLFFFLQSGFVKVGTITPDGNEMIYDVRKSGDVIGELCASEKKRLDRAVALEQTYAIGVPFEEIMAVLLQKPDLAAMLVEIFCRALKEAYAQVNTFASHDIIRRLSKVLLGLATKVGQKSDSLVEIPTYLTQEEISQMVAARRERVSTALNLLRRQGMVHYSTRGHLMLDVRALERHGT
jgi:CRP/FNR family transcriptional regulator, cyclic AMP receptor protein